MSNDLWKNRNKKMSCSTCMWFVAKIKNVDETPPTAQVGRCRRHAPTIDGYPVVFRNDWCGDHKLDEDKV